MTAFQISLKIKNHIRTNYVENSEASYPSIPANTFNPVMEYFLAAADFRSILD